MMLPISVQSLLDQRTIESNRIEYKTGWNPEKILHSICAFANDIEDVGGGYIIIGVEDEGGTPGTIVGVETQDIQRIEGEVHRVCNMIEPRYIPQFEVAEVGGKKVIALWAFSDLNRPYKCPVSLSEGKGSGKAYFIRHASHTVRATREEETALLWLSSKVTFDDLINAQAGLKDVEYNRILEYLEKVGSSLATSRLSKSELMASMRLTRGSSESLKPLNIALMMFSDDPERFFPYARVEIVVKSDSAGNIMDERVCRGPVDWQILCALRYLSNNVISELVRKVPEQAEAVRVKNYPIEALEEALVNAVYHKDYNTHEPVVVTVNPDSIEIVSYPGPDPSISDEQIRGLNMRSRYCRNKRLGDFLKELDLAEGRNTGMAKIVERVEANGSELPIYETDADRTYLSVTFPIHPEFRKVMVGAYSPEDVVQNAAGCHTGGTSCKRRDLSEVKMGILDQLSTKGCMTSKDLYTALGYTSMTSGFRKCIRELMDDGYIRYLYPDKPRDNRQKLCMTVRYEDKG